MKFRKQVQEIQEIKKDFETIKDYVLECKLITLSMQLDSCMVICKLSDDIEEIKRYLAKFQECFTEYNQILNELYRL